MSNWVAAFWSWLPSIGSAAAILVSSAALFVLWLFLDCSFPQLVSIAGQDIRFRFLHDAHLRYYHRWSYYGSRLLLFAILAVPSTIAACIIFVRIAFGGGMERSLTNVSLSIAVAAIWIGLITQNGRIWWLAFRSRVQRLLPAVKRAAETLQKWPSSSVSLAGLGSYEPPEHDSTRLLHADPTLIPYLWEDVGVISRSGEDCLRFSIDSYTHAADDSFRRCCIERRRKGWSPPPVSVTEVRSPPYVRTVQHESEYPLGNGWYLAFYKTQLTFKLEPDPAIVAEVAKRPPELRLPHCGRRFRAKVDTPVQVWHLTYLPSGLPVAY